MLKTTLLVAAASLLFALPASAADLPFSDAPQVAPIAPAHMVCDDDGNCYRTHAPRYVERWHDNDDDDDGDVYVRRDYRPRYGAPGAGFYRNYDDDGPVLGVDVDAGRW